MESKRERLRVFHRNLSQAVLFGGNIVEVTKMNVSKINKALVWKDISEESYRTYLFPIEGQYFPQLAEVRINRPLILNVNNKSGGHRVVDKSGKSHYIPAGWVQLLWEGHEDGVPTYMF